MSDLTFVKCLTRERTRWTLMGPQLPSSPFRLNYELSRKREVGIWIHPVLGDLTFVKSPRPRWRPSELPAPPAAPGLALRPVGLGPRAARRTGCPVAFFANHFVQKEMEQMLALQRHIAVSSWDLRPDLAGLYAGAACLGCGPNPGRVWPNVAPGCGDVLARGPLRQAVAS
jgi:hypothetical protein